MVSATLPCHNRHRGRRGQSQGLLSDRAPCRAAPCHAELCHDHAEPWQRGTGCERARGWGERACGRARRVGTARLAAGPVCAGGSGRASGRESAGGRCGERRPRPHRDALRQPGPAAIGGEGGLYFFTACFTASRKGSFWKPRLPARRSRPARCRLHALWRGPPARPGLGAHQGSCPWATPGTTPLGCVGAAGPAGRTYPPVPVRAGAGEAASGPGGARCRFPGPRAGRSRAPGPRSPCPGSAPGAAGAGRIELPETTSPTLIPEASRRD